MFPVPGTNYNFLGLANLHLGLELGGGVKNSYNIEVADWYKGTANAIYQNLDFIRQYDPELVLILSGDHIYRMDYSDMIFCHKDTGAVCTVATISVPVTASKPWENSNKLFICRSLRSERLRSTCMR